VCAFLRCCCCCCFCFISGHIELCAYKPTTQRQITEMTKQAHIQAYPSPHHPTPPTFGRPFSHMPKNMQHFLYVSASQNFCAGSIIKFFSAAAVTFFLRYCCCCCPAFGLWPGFYAAFTVCACVCVCVVCRRVCASVCECFL